MKTDIEIEKDGRLITDEEEIANLFVNFFIDKVKKLSEGAVPESTKAVRHLDAPPPRVTPEMVHTIARKLMNKKSCGLDGTPMCVIKDTEPYLRESYCHLFNLAMTRIRTAWKMANITPLFKKGEKTSLNNYRPISNLSSVGKFFEKIILELINAEGRADVDGVHQHGFRTHHSTTTPILDIQQIVAENLNQKRDCINYSVDLSAAFDMLRRDTLHNIIKGEFSKGLHNVIYDFLSDRKCVVSIGEKRSVELKVSCGCVQGSVLGPKLFNPYTKDIPNHLTENA